MPVEPSDDLTAPPELRTRAPSMNFDSTVPRQLVHRNYIDHVLITDVQRLEEDHFLCAARLPQMHGYFNEEWKTPCCNVLAISEIVRQACIAITHRYLEVPEGTAQIVRRAGGSMEALAPARALTPTTADFLIEVTLSDRQHRRSGELTALNAAYAGYSELTRVFRGSGEWLFVPKKMYRRLRHQAAEPPSDEAAAARDRLIAPAVVGRRTRDHVFIATPLPHNGGTVYTTELIADPQHPFFFEHTLDHVSGMLLLEGCNQFALALAAELYGYAPRDICLVGYAIRFHRFAGLEAPVRLTTSIDPGRAASPGVVAASFEITAAQDEEVLAEVAVTVAPRPVEGAAGRKPGGGPPSPERVVRE